MTNDDPVQRLLDEKPFRETHPLYHLKEDTMQWLGKHGENVDSIVRLERLRREHADAFVELTAACRDENRRQVVAALLHNGGTAQYDELMTYTSCTRRTVQNHVYDLRDKEILEVEKSRPAVISFASEPIEILAEDILSKFYSTLE